MSVPPLLLPLPPSLSLARSIEHLVCATHFGLQIRLEVARRRSHSQQQQQQRSTFRRVAAAAAAAALCYVYLYFFYFA